MSVPASELALPHPIPSQASVSPSLDPKGGGATLSGGWGVGEPSSDDWKESLALCILFSAPFRHYPTCADLCSNVLWRHYSPRIWILFSSSKFSLNSFLLFYQSPSSVFPPSFLYKMNAKEFFVMKEPIWLISKYNSSHFLIISGFIFPFCIGRQKKASCHYSDFFIGHIF